jgi:hypothetical protein
MGKAAKSLQRSGLSGGPTSMDNRSDWFSAYISYFQLLMLLEMAAMHGNAPIFNSLLVLIPGTNRAISVVIGPSTGRKLHRVLLDIVMR